MLWDRGFVHVNPSAKYADYYERTILNHILSSQHPEHGVGVYFTSARPRHYRIYSAPNEPCGVVLVQVWKTMVSTTSSFIPILTIRCPQPIYCFGTELERKRVKIKQETSFPYEEQTKLTVTQGSSTFKLLVRYPSWVAKGELKISVNDKEVAYSATPSSYVSIDRKWQKGDVVKITLPMRNTIEHLPNVPEYIAIMHGPVLLGQNRYRRFERPHADDSRLDNMLAENICLLIKPQF